MTFIDTHAHLYAEQFNGEREEMIQRAFDNNVDKIFLPNIDEGSVKGMEELVRKYPNQCYSMMGVHPCNVQKDWQIQLETIKKAFKKNHHIAIGEIGMDLYWDKSLEKEQALMFEAQIKWAKKEQLPIVIHARNSFDEIFEIVDQLNDDELFGVFHCFTGTEEQAKKIIDYGGFKLGVGGVVTFKNGGLDKVLAKIPLEHLVLETDAPYLAPAPYRGKTNESSYIPIIAHKLAAIYTVSVEEIGKTTTNNAKEVFKLTN